MPIDLIMTDLDGTFAIDRYDFCEKNKEAVRLAQQQGIRVCACTARNWAMAKGQVCRAGFDSYTIACNGASLVDNATGLPIERTRFESSDVERLLRLGVGHHALVAVYTNEQILCLKGVAACEYTSYEKDWENIDRDLAIPVTMCKDVREMAILGAEASELIEIIHPGVFNLSEEEREFLRRFSITEVDLNTLHIMRGGISKLYGAKRLAELFNVDKERVMAIGDNRNDAEMLKWAGIGVAMSDGDEYAKAAADFITKEHHDEAGFYHAVMEVLNGRQ